MIVISPTIFFAQIAYFQRSYNCYIPTQLLSDCLHEEAACVWKHLMIDQKQHIYYCNTSIIIQFPQLQTNHNACSMLRCLPMADNDDALRLFCAVGRTVSAVAVPSPPHGSLWMMQHLFTGNVIMLACSASRHRAQCPTMSDP